MRYSEYLEKKKEDPTFGMSPLSRQNLNNRLSELNALIGGYQTDVDSLLDDYKMRNEGYVAGTYRGDTAAWYKDTSSRADAIGEKATAINSFLDRYGQYYDPEYVSKVKNSLANNRYSLDSIRNQAGNEWSYWGRWDDENAYNAYLDRINTTKDRWAGIEAEAAELGKIRDALDGTSKYSSHTYGEYAQAAGRYTNYKNNQKHNQNSNNPIDTWMYGPGAGSGKEYGAERAAQDQALMQKAHASNPYYSTLYNGLKSENELTNEYDQRYEQFAANFNEVAPIIATSDPDYEKYVEEGKRKAKQASAHEESFSKENLASYNKDTRNLAYYYLGKGEVDYAKLVLGITYNDDTIAYLQGRNLAAEKVNDSFLAEIPRKIYHSAVDAFQSTGDKLKNYLTENDEYVAPSKHGYAVQFAQADDEDLKALLGKGAISLGRLAPSVLVSTVATAITKNPSMGAKIGSVVFGLGAAADAYNEKIREGYTATQAYTYGTLSGVSEVVLERILGGAGTFIGGKFGKAIANKFDDGLKTVSRWINKAIGRVATEHSDDFLKFAANGKAVWGDGVQEWFEEVVQTALEPGFEYIATGHTDGVTAEELFYNGVVGFLTAPLSSPIKVASGAYHGAKAAVNAANKSDYNHMANKMGANFDANGDSIPVVPGAIAETKTAAVTDKDNIPVVPGSSADVSAKAASKRDVNSAEDVMAMIGEQNERMATQRDIESDFAEYVSENDEYASDILADSEIKSEITSYDGEVKTGTDNFVPSNGVVEARDPNKEYMETGKLVPLTADQEWRQMEAAKAKNDIQKSGILAGVSKADIAIAEIAAKVTGRNIIFRSDEYGINGHFDGENTIFINPDRKDGVLSQVIAHELVHSTEGTEAYKALVNSVKAFVEANNFVDSNGVARDWDYYVTEAHAQYDTRYKELTNKVFTDEKADREAVAKIIESFFSDTAIEGTNTQAALDTWLADYVQSNRNAVARMWYSLSKTARRLGEDIAAKFKKGGNTPELQKQREMLRRIEDIRDSFGRALIVAKKAKAAKKGDVAYAVESKTQPGMLDPQTVTEADVREMLEDVQYGLYDDDTFVPLRRNTPQFFIDVVKEHSNGKYYIEDHPMMSRVRHMRQNMEVDEGQSYGDERPHNLTVDDIITISYKMGDPAYIVLQENGRYAEVVSFYDDRRKKRVLVVIDAANPNKKKGNNYIYSQYLNGFSEGFYNVIVTQLELDDLNAYLKNNEVVYDKTKMNGKYQVGSGRIVTVTHDTPFIKNSISHPDESVNSKSEFSFTEGSDYGTMPMTEKESMMRDRALEMYDKLDRGEDIGMPKDMEDANEYIYGLTGWARNEFGNLIVDHEAPVYLKERTDRETAAERRADIESARASASGTEAAVLRAERDELKVRAEAAEKAKRILERDMNWRIAADRQLSPNFTHSRDQVRGIVKELCDMFGGHYNDGQIRGFTERLQQLYDKIGTDAKYAADVTKFSREISGLITDMQDVRIKNTDNAVIAERLRAELRTPIFLSDKARRDFAEGYGKMAKQYRGKVNFVSKERGTPVDVRYMELSDAFPEWFPSDITNEADQAKRILEISDIIRDDNFTSHDRYADVGADPKEVRNADFDSALMRILNGYAELEAVPVTFADGLMRQLEFERREHQRELARMTDEERAKAEKKHNAEVERIMREAEQAMEWETKHLRDDISELEGQIKAEDDRKKAAAAEKDRREHLRGRDIKDAAIKAARSDKSFTKKMTELYERYNDIENELERVKSECKKYEKVSLDKLSKGMREYVETLRERRDALAEDKANLAAYINKVNERVKGIRFKTLVEMIEKDGYLKKWKDKKAPIFYSVNTMRRNIFDIAPENSELARYIIDEIIDPIVNATAEATRLKNDIRERVRKLELSTKAKKGDTMSESQFVQAYAEAKDNIEALEKGEGSFIYDKYGNPCREGMNLEEWRGFLNRIIEENKGITDDKQTMERIEKAVEEFKLIYDNLFESVNAARVRNGYAPVPYHRGYFPHYNNDTAQDNIFAKMLDGFGLRTQDISEKLPTSINGLTSTFKPGIRYMSAAKQRSMAGFEGERVVTGAVEGVDRYLEVAADIAYLTDYVQELRSLSKAIRYATTSEATKERIDEIRADDSLTQDDKQTRINEIFANKTDKTKYALSNFVVELEEYTNLLAGKKSRRDREWESEFGRAIYNLGKKITRNVGANQIVGNVSSWITNTVPLTQGTAIMHYHMLTGLFDMIKGNISDDGFAASSTFLTNRRGSDRLIKTGLEKATDAASFGMPLIDNFVSEWLMRARVAQNMSKLGGNMSREAALAEADTFISGMMANRTKAEMPTIFAAQNPLYKMFTTYQLEVANQFAFYKDLWRYDEEKLAKFLAQLFFTYLLSKIYNDYFEKLTGRRPAFDPLEILNDLGGDIFGYKLASFDDIVRGDIVEETEQKNPATAVKENARVALEEMPYIGAILGGGRIPISSALPDFEALGNAFKGAVGNLYDEDDPRHDGAAGANDVIENLYKGFSGMIYYGMIPFAGGAIKKVVEGGVAIAKGGSYIYSTEGERQLQYPVYQDSTREAVWNGVKTILFGKTSTEGGREWVEGGFGSLSAKNTSLYETLVEDGTSQHDAFEAVNTVRKSDNQLGKAEALLEIDYLSDEAKFEIFKTLVTESTKKIEAAQAIIDKDGDFDEYLEDFVEEKKESENKEETDEKDGKKKKTNSGNLSIDIPKFEIPKYDIEIPKFKF